VPSRSSWLRAVRAVALAFSSATVRTLRPEASHIFSISSQLKRVTLRSISTGSLGLSPVAAQTQALAMSASRTIPHDLASVFPSGQSPGGGVSSTQAEYTGQPHTRQ